MLYPSTALSIPEGKDTESLIYRGQTCTPDLAPGESAPQILELIRLAHGDRLRISDGVVTRIKEDQLLLNDHSSEAICFQYYDVREPGHPSQLFPELPGEGVVPIWSILYLVKRQFHMPTLGSLSRYEDNVFEIEDDLFFVEGGREPEWSLYLGCESDGARFYTDTRLFTPVEPGIG